MARLFGSSGIRGIYGEKITPELALNVGKAVGTYLKKGRAIIARDTRLTSEILENAVVAGLESAGLHAFRAGVAPTPTLAWAARGLKMQAGIMITASHNPPEYNGIKLWQADSSAYIPDMEKQIEGHIEYALGKEGNLGTREMKSAKWQDIGQSSNSNIIEEYANEVAGYANISKKHKIALDCGNGAACAVSPKFLERFGTVSKIFCEPDGRFPGRGIEPAEENLSALKKLVVETRSETGFAHDGDADRVAAVDEKGNFVGKDQLLAVLALNELENSKGTVVFPVDTSLLVEEVAEKAGGKVKMTPIGDVFVAAEMKKSNALFGGEPCGAFIFPKFSWCPDGILGSLKILELIENGGMPLSKIIAGLPKYVTKRATIKCTEEKKEKVCAQIYEKIRSIKGAGDVIEIDGVRANFEGSWILARPSGTEPKIRITAEAKTEQRAEELLRVLEKLPNLS